MYDVIFPGTILMSDQILLLLTSFDYVKNQKKFHSYYYALIQDYCLLVYYNSTFYDHAQFNNFSLLRFFIKNL